MEINNRSANYNYQVLDTIEAGIVLKGTELKYIRNCKTNIQDNYANIMYNLYFI